MSTDAVSDTPFDILGSITSISFDDLTSLPIEDHALTIEEVNVTSLSLWFVLF